MVGYAADLHEGTIIGLQLHPVPERKVLWTLGIISFQFHLDFTLEHLCFSYFVLEFV